MGQYAGTMPGFKHQLEILAGQTSLATVPAVLGTVNLPKESTICAVELVIAPELAIATFLKTNYHGLVYI